MIPARRQYALGFALVCLLPTALSRALWISQEYDPLAGNTLAERAATCGGDSALKECGNSFPSDFCCPTGTHCLALNASSSVNAAICCPKGEDCMLINLISCDESLQDASKHPSSQMHSQPPQKLQKCGTQCCPIGYVCADRQCVSESLFTSSSSTSSATTPGATKAPDSQPTTGNGSPLGAPSSTSSTSGFFNARSFAAGFVPGIAIGAIIAALIILLCLRRRRKTKTYVNEKENGRDTLTDLSPQQPSAHGRSISDPTVDPTTGYRTDFLRSSPHRSVELDGTTANTYHNEPASPTDRTPRVRALFSRSPATPNGPPVPPHQKRGTFGISPVRALKKQKSMHSLRRQMTDSRPGLSRAGSTETIQVLMPSDDPYTHDHPDRITEGGSTSSRDSATDQQPPALHSTWTTTTSSDHTPDERHPTAQQIPFYQSSSRYPSSRYPSSHYPSNIPDTPTRPPVPRLPSMVVTDNGGAPSSNFLAPPAPLKVDRSAPIADNRRDTTFSSMMERANIDKEALKDPEVRRSTSRNAGGASTLAPPPIPDSGGLRVPGGGMRNTNDYSRRDTTFSGMMAKVGLKKSDLQMGSNAKK